MLDFICFILPGVFFSFVTEALLRRRFSLHGFVFLAVANVLLVNISTLGIRYFVIEFLIPLSGSVTSLDMEAAVGILKFLAVAGAAGTVLSLLEAFAAKFFSLAVVSKKETQEHEG